MKAVGDYNHLVLLSKTINRNYPRRLVVFNNCPPKQLAVIATPFERPYFLLLVHFKV